jgi:translation elongation factor EF-G
LKLIEKVVESDDALMEKYLAGQEMTEEELKQQSAPHIVR